MTIEEQKIEKTSTPEKKERELLMQDIINQKLNDLETQKSTREILDLLKNKPDGTKTNMYQKLEKLEGQEFNIEKFAKDIDITVKKFLYQSFLDAKGEIKIDDKVINSMSVGIQFAMMSSLTETGEKGSDFFSSFSNLKLDDSGSIFKGLMNVFGSNKGILGKIGDVNNFYKLANRFQNCINYISYHSGVGKEIGDGSKTPELTNGNKFRKLLDNNIWDSGEGLMNRKISEVGITMSEEGGAVEMSESDRSELQGIADNMNMPIDVKTINSIKNAIPTAQNLLEKRLTYKSNISGLMDTVGNILNINLLGFGTIGSLLGIKSPIDFLRSKKGEKKGIIDFVLNIMGFQGGVEGLHREYVRKNIDENLDSDEKKEFISDLYKYYDKEKQVEYKGKTTIEKFNLSKMDEGLKAKIPSQYDVLKQSLVDNLKGKENMVNPSILEKYGMKAGLKSEKFVDGNGKVKTRLVIDETKFDKSKINTKFIDTYLEDNIKTLISDENFMKDIENPDQFVLSLMGNLVAGSWFIEGVLVGEELVDNYLVEEEKEQGNEKAEKVENNEEVEFSGGDVEILGKIETELKKYNSPIKAEDVLGASKSYGVPVEYIMAFMKNDSSYATAGKGVRTNNPGNIGNDDAGNEKNYDNLKDGVYALGKHLKRRINEYQKVYGLILIPTAKQLADNVGPDGKGFLSSQENYKKLNPDRKGAYMSMKTGGNTVNNFAEDLVDFGITNYGNVA